MSLSQLNLRLAQQIDYALRTGTRRINVIGSDSDLYLAATLAQTHRMDAGLQAHVIVLESKTHLDQFAAALKVFSPELRVHKLLPFDLSPYSGLYPNPKVLGQRLRWLFHAQNPSPKDVFLATIEGLQQKTLPFDALSKNSLLLKADLDLEEDLHGFLTRLGYHSTSMVEAPGQYALRGGVLDVFSPVHDHPVRVELFGETIESLRLFDQSNQRSLDSVDRYQLIPSQEVILDDAGFDLALESYRRQFLEKQEGELEGLQEVLHGLSKYQYFQGLEYLLPYFYKTPANPLEHFCGDFHLWLLEPVKLAQTSDQWMAELKSEYRGAENAAIRPRLEEFYSAFDDISEFDAHVLIQTEKVPIDESDRQQNIATLEARSALLAEFQSKVKATLKDKAELISYLTQKLSAWIKDDYRILFFASTESQAQRLKLLLEDAMLDFEALDDSWVQWLNLEAKTKIAVVQKRLTESQRLIEEKLIFISGDDLFGKRSAKRTTTTADADRGKALSFAELKVGDYVVHKTHGVGIYEGLTVMDVFGSPAEFIQLQYKDKNKLYLPVYRVSQIQKYMGPQNPGLVNRLGGTSWEKTKTKVRNHVRDMASELLKLYAQRAQSERPPFSIPGHDFIAFENQFPFEETEDQLKAINNVISDLTSEKPMDRLVCGDVGFGKTEIAMRAAFKAIEDGKQVAVVAPTTILSFQHLENFKKRFKQWPVKIAALNRFVSKPDQRRIVQQLKDGEVDIIIGTHRLFSKDIAFKDIGLLIIDEEQKFGVKHKEKIRQWKHSVDTLAMSATPIPRTLNMSLMGIRDLSLIQTAPVDRQPTRTFITRFDKKLIRQAVENEVSRGGQIFFLHNRVQSIYGLHDELRSFLGDFRIAVAHGQMKEDELEKTMVSFFNHEVDILLCTTIIESGMDIPRANTMFIDQAHQLGLSQLYQLRGRVGRSKERAYCYLLLPRNRQLDKQAQERLKILQENSALGSGMQIAQYDLELRGAGDMLGEDQSGHINAVGYELYLELLEEAIHEMKGEPLKEVIEPEINLKIPAFIPDKYIEDIRIRLAYYKRLSEIKSPEDLDQIEDDLRDQFGKPPEEVINLLGVMLIRKISKDLAIKDVSAGAAKLSLTFSDQTPLSVETVLKLTARDNKKYQLTPDQRLNIRMNELNWPRVLDEMNYLRSLV